MDEDRPARAAALRTGIVGIRRVGIGDAQRQVIGTVRIAIVDRVSPLGRPLVALETLGPDRRSAETILARVNRRPVASTKVVCDGLDDE